MSDAKPQPSEAAKAAAQLFHDTYERLAPSFGYETRKDTKQFDPGSPNGRLMIAVCGEILASQTEELLRLKRIHVESTQREISLQSQLAELARDKERLDWFDSRRFNDFGDYTWRVAANVSMNLRQAIDGAYRQSTGKSFDAAAKAKPQ